MAYLASFVKLTFSGSISGQDTWSNSLSLSSENFEGSADLFEDLEPSQFATAATAFYRGTSGGMATYNTLDQIKMALIGVDGKTIGEPKVYYYSTPQAGTYSGSVIPQASIAVSLVTDLPRGLASKGRIFLPSGFGDVGNTDGKLSTVTTNAIATRTKTFLDAINTIGDSVVPAGAIAITSNVRTGAVNTVTGVRVGNLVDVQRRRRNRLTETYVDAALSA